jgi:serine/threonine protein phosphatase PrpC
MTPPLVEWTVASRSLGSESGDQYLVSRTGDGGVLVAVVDGLGHGPEAASAAKTAIAVLEAGDEGEVGARFLRCHECLRHTRGVVLSLGLFTTGCLTWLGVGNVDGVLLRSAFGAPEQLLVRSGVVGRRLPSLALSRLAVAPGDTLILATDGIQSGFAEDRDVAFAATVTAERILADHGKEDDDALVLVVRYLGPRV